MATLTQSIAETIELPVALKCDRCGRVAPVSGAAHEGADAALGDYFEAQEFLRIDCVSGYGSVFGDEARVQGDFCQYCVKELLGEWVRVGK